MVVALQVFAVQNVTEIRTFSSFPRTRTELLLKPTRERFTFDPDSLAQDIGDGRFFRPLDISTTSPGRWVPSVITSFESAAFISGFVPTLGADADHDVAISRGSAIDLDGSKILRSTLPLTKQIDAAWVEGGQAGGRFTASLLADAVYHLHVIKRDSDLKIDAGFDTDINGVNTPSGWTPIRRVHSVLTDGASNIIPFSAVEIEGGGLHVLWTDPPLDVDDSDSADTAEIRTLSVPTGFKVVAEMNVYSKKVNYLSSLDADDEASSDSVAPLGNTIEDGFSKIHVRTNTLGQIRSRAKDGGDILRIATLGYQDWRRA